MLRKVFVFAAIVVLLTPSWPTRAQDEIASPLPSELRRPLATFLAATGWKNADLLPDFAKFWKLTDQIFLIRVTDRTTCDDDGDLCLSIIGSLRNGGFVSEAVFYAGGEVKAANNSFSFGGPDGPSLFFVRFLGKKQSVIAMPAPTGWIILPTGAIDEFKGPKKN